jgi:two-component system NarL family sensor kinase
MSAAAAAATATAVAVVGAVGAVLSAALASRSGTSTAADQIAIAVTILVSIASGLVVTVHRPAERVGWLLLLGGSLWGAGEALLLVGVHGQVVDPGSVALPMAWGVLGTAARGLGWLVLVVALPYWFPDGRAPWPARRWPGRVLVAALVGFTVATVVAPKPLETRLAPFDNPLGLPSAWQPVADLLALVSLALAAVALVMSLAGLVHRWRRGDAFRRQQLRWFAAAFALPLTLLPFVATDLVRPWMFAAVVLPVPVLIGVALLQRRLYDIRLVASRSITYVLLSACVAMLYAVTVAGVGALLGLSGAPWLGWVGAGVVAVSFAPLHTSLRAGVNRITYGQWAEPATVLAQTSRRLADTADVPALLQSLMREIADALHLRCVWVSNSGGEMLASYGDPQSCTPPVDEAGREGVPHPGEPGRYRLTAYGLEVGHLGWVGRIERPADRELLEHVAQQIGGVVHSAGLVQSLTRAHEQLVRASEDERRRLRRDLHDGLGPELAALTLRVDALRNQAHSPGLDLDAELVHLRTGIQVAVADVRRVVEGLRPPAVDDLGLGTAIEQLASRIVVGPPLTLDVAPLPELPAAVEAAAFRVAQEALTNAVRHADARAVHVRLHAVDGVLLLEVSDDGRGAVAARPGGVGLTSMRERAAEVGGRLDVQSAPGAGTTVRLQAPLPSSVATRHEATA